MEVGREQNRPVTQTMGTFSLQGRLSQNAIKAQPRVLCQVLLALWVIISFAGCAADHYHFGLTNADSLGGQGTVPLSRQHLTNVRSGANMPQIDKLEAVVQTPRRMVRKLFRRPEATAGQVAQQREEAFHVAEEYLAANGMTDVNIDLRLYDPKLQWTRLTENEQISPWWRFSGGTISWLRYTMLPMRALHTDHYDPFTNTLHLNSTRPLQALYESASAKEYKKHRELGPIKVGTGTYAMIQNVPFVPLAHNANASSDVLTYAKIRFDSKISDDLYPMVYARLGSTAVSETLSVVSLNTPFYTTPLLRVAGGMAGRLTGKAAATSERTKTL